VNWAFALIGAAWFKVISDVYMNHRSDESIHFHQICKRELSYNLFSFLIDSKYIMYYFWTAFKSMSILILCHFLFNLQFSNDCICILTVRFYSHELAAMDPTRIT